MIKVLRYVIIFIIIIGLAGWIFFNYQIIAPVSLDKTEVEFTIEPGWGVNQISQQLLANNLIRSKFWFEACVWLKGLERNFIAGVYELSPAMNIKEIIAKLTHFGESERMITIIEGWNNQEITQYLAGQGLASQDEFLSIVNHSSSIINQQYSFLAGKPASASLEGYMFPDTYRVFRNTTAQEIVKKMLDNFEQKLTNDLKSKIKDQGQTIFEIITLASIIEKEVRNPEDMKMVADIFYKRLNKGMALQSDATVNYITGKGLLQPTLEDTQIDNRYNTYKYPGLPPGPISNPGLNAITAAIEPTSNPYYYFLTANDGAVIYSKTYEEHLQNKAKYLK